MTETSTPRTVAFIDIGTNSIRLLVVSIAPNHSYRVITDQKEVVRLGENEFQGDELQPAAIDRAVLVCTKFAELAHSHEAAEIIAVATAAAREASNREELLRRLREEAQLDVRVVSGLEEARLIYLGVASGVHLGDKQALFIDIGGGSTEVILGDQRQYHHLYSLSLGAIRLTTLFLDGESGPIEPEEYGRLKKHVCSEAVRAIRELKESGIDLAIGSSGTIENLADIAIRQAYKRRRERDDVMTYGQLQDVVKLLCSLALEKRRQVPGINPERADIIIGGMAILDTLMEELDLKEIAISDRGLRDGLLVDYLARSEHAPLVQQLSVRERSVLQLGRASGFDEKHARNVARLALELFDSARESGLHDLGERERELLRYAAMLHDIGAFLSYANHHCHTYYMILNADLLGFDQTETAIMATTALYHRKALPRKSDAEFKVLGKDEQEIVELLSILLRIAENLDRGHVGVVRHARLRAEGKKKAVLEIEAKGDPQLELWGIESRQEVIEKGLGRKLTVAITPP